MCDPIHPTVCRVHHSHSRMGDKFRTVCFIDHHLLAVCNVLEQSGAGVQILWSGTRAREEGTFSKTITITSQRKDPQCLCLVWVPPAWVHINTGDGWCHIPGLVFPPSQVINQAFNLLQSLPTQGPDLSLCKRSVLFAVFWLDLCKWLQSPSGRTPLTRSRPTDRTL